MDILAYGGKAVKRKAKQDPMVYWNSLVRPPVNYYVSDLVINKLREYNNSARLMNNPIKRFKLVNELLAPYGFKSLAPGTNRRTFYCEYDPNIILKLASDAVGCNDNLRDVSLQNIIKPYVPKVFSCTTDGILSLIERVEVMTEYDYRHTWANEIFDLIITLAERGYLVEDIGSNFFKNLGVRLGFGPVLLDAPYIYRVDPRKLKCIKINPVTQQICGGNIDYNYEKGMSEIICTKCGARYSAKYLSASDELINETRINTGRNFEMNALDTNLKVRVIDRKTGNVVNQYYNESDYQLPVNNNTGIVEPSQVVVNPNVVVVDTKTNSSSPVVPGAVGQTQEPAIQKAVEEPRQIVNNPSVVAITTDGSVDQRKLYEEFLQYKAANAVKKEEKPVSKITLFGQEFPGDIVTSLASKFGIQTVNESTITQFVMLAISNKEMTDTIMKQLSLEEGKVVRDISVILMKSFENGTNPAIKDTNAADQVVNVVPEEQKKVEVTIPAPKAPVEEPVKMTTFAGLPASEELVNTFNVLLPDIHKLVKDEDKRMYLCRADVVAYIKNQIPMIKSQRVRAELLNYGATLATKFNEDIEKAKAKETTNETMTVNVVETPVETPKQPETTKPVEKPKTDKDKVYQLGKSKNIPAYAHYMKNGKEYIMYPKEVANPIFYCLGKIERQSGFEVAKMLADKLSINYISQEDFVSKKNPDNTTKNDQPKTVVPPERIVVSTESDATRKVENTVAEQLDQNTINKLNHLKEQTLVNQVNSREKGEVVFQGQNKNKETNWKQRNTVKSEPVKNNEVTPAQTPAATVVPEQRPTEGLFPMKPKNTEDGSSVYDNMNTGTAVLGFPGEPKVDTMRIQEMLPKLQDMVYVRFNNFNPPNANDADDFSAKLATSIREFIAPEVQKIMQDDGSGFEVNVQHTNDERNRDCYRVIAFQHGSQLFGLYLYPLGSDKNKNQKLADGILYAQGQKQINEFLNNTTPELKLNDTPTLDVTNTEEVKKFFNKKLRELDLTGVSNVETGKRFVAANLLSRILDETKGSITSEKANELVTKFINEDCQFSLG